MATSSIPASNNISATTAVTNNDAQMNFNPSWMQSTAPPMHRSLSVSNANNNSLNNCIKQAVAESDEACEPIFAKHSYGREDLLAMMGKDNNLKAPSGIDRCPFFVGTAQTPIILMPFTETEMRLQQNLNSSKALSAFSRTQGVIAGGGGGGGGSVDGLNNNNEAGGGGGWTTAGTSRVTGSFGSGRNKHHVAGQNDASAGAPGKPVPSRWSALGSTTGAPAPPLQRQPWKSNVNNAAATGGTPPAGSGGGSGRLTGSGTTASSNGGAKQFEGRVGSGGGTTDALADTISNTNSTNKKHLPPDQQQQQERKALESKKQSSTSPPSTAQEATPTKAQTPPKPPNVAAVEAAAPTPPVQPQQTTVADQWYYLDPAGMVRGPFDSQQMQTWHSGGYFSNTLLVRRKDDNPASYIKLGELYQLNGEDTPFIAKSVAQKTPSPPQPPTQSAAFASIQQRPDLLTEAAATATALGGISPSLTEMERIWATTPLEDVIAPVGTTAAATPGAGASGAPSAVTSTVPSGFAHSLKEFGMDKVFQSKEMQIMEEQRKLREKEELLRRDEHERVEKEHRMREMEADLKRQQDELSRKAREKDAEFEQRCLQMVEYERKRREELAALEQRIRNEHLQQQLRLEEADRRRAKDLEEMLQREQERQRQLVDAEVVRKRDEEEVRMRLALKEQHHQRELAQEHARRAEEEQRRRLIEEQQRAQQKALEEARAERAKQQQVAAKAEAAAKAEQQRVIAAAQQQQQPPQPPRPVWQPIPTPPTQPIPLQIPVQQQPPPQQQQPAVAEQRRGWQPVQAPKPAPIPPPITKTGSGAGATAKQPHSNNAKQQKAAQKQKQQQHTLIEDKLTVWIIKRVKELNPSVDAEVFASFISEVDSPNEAEDYIIGYLGEKKEVKEFHRDFLRKRIELRPRVQHQPQKDDLSRPAAALNTDAEQPKGGAPAAPHPQKSAGGGVGSSNGRGGTSGNGSAGEAGAAANKKKKQKGQKVIGGDSHQLKKTHISNKFTILDPTVLGFRPSGDPNRVNAGEIDSIPLSAAAAGGNNKKRL